MIANLEETAECQRSWINASVAPDGKIHAHQWPQRVQQDLPGAAGKISEACEANLRRMTDGETSAARPHSRIGHFIRFG